MKHPKYQPQDAINPYTNGKKFKIPVHIRDGLEKNPVHFNLIIGTDL
jgi:hypothetical protein